MEASLRIRDELAALMPQASFVKNKSIAVLLPCHNEEATIADVIEGFRKALPGAAIYVYDNNSTDDTAVVAAAAGATVRRERNLGKGNVVRRMFADIEADIYVLADGDLTYDASAAGRLVDALVADNVDMVVGVRRGTKEAFRHGHRFGNRLFNRVVAHLFGPGFTDILSGYRVVSRRFVKSFPASSSGFEIESELSVHALDLKLATTEIELSYGERPSEFRQQAQHLSRRRPHFFQDPDDVSGAEAVEILRRDLACLARAVVGAGRAVAADLRRDRPGAALPDRDTCRQPDATRRYEPPLRRRHRCHQRQPA